MPSVMHTSFRERVQSVVSKRRIQCSPGHPIFKVSVCPCLSMVYCCACASSYCSHTCGGVGARTQTHKHTHDTRYTTHEEHTHKTTKTIRVQNMKQDSHLRQPRVAQHSTLQPSMHHASRPQHPSQQRQPSRCEVRNVAHAFSIQILSNISSGHFLAACNGNGETAAEFRVGQNKATISVVASDQYVPGKPVTSGTVVRQLSIEIACKSQGNFYLFD
jgi:hypothetical protein